MVRLYCAALLQRGTGGAVPLCAAHELSSFSFFQRSSVQEFLSFVCKTLAERTAPGARQSVREGEYMVHIYARVDGLCAALVADHEYPQRVAHTLLTRILDEFSAAVPPANRVEGAHFPALVQLLQRYQNPREADALTRVQDELDETKIVLHNTIAAVLERGEKLDDLVAKSDSLSASSKAFYTTARKTNSCCSF